MKNEIKDQDSFSNRSTNPFNPTLFQYDIEEKYKWKIFEPITIATITWNRLAHTRIFIDSIFKYSHIPYRMLIVDNGSTDGTVDFLRSLSAHQPHVTVIENGRNLGLLRALQQIRDNVHEGLIVYCDNDMEVLTNYWLVLILKAFYAAKLSYSSLDTVLGMRVINLDEYGFRYASRREILPVSSEKNSEPRTSYARTSKDNPDSRIRLDEEIVIGWTEYLMGGAQAIPANIFKKIKLENCYPLFIGGTDAFMSSEFLRIGVKMGYIENGPIVRHNDWPYTKEKIQLYENLTTRRAVTDRAYILWKVRDLLRRMLSRSGLGS